MTVPEKKPAAPAPAAPAPSASTSEPRHEEYQYLDLVREILDQGDLRQDRTGTGTYSIFAPRPLKFSLNRNGTPILPLLTTKRVFTKAVIAELLWFISGDTSSHTLSSQGVKIWDGNGSREFLDGLGLTDREPGDLGPVYGFQWRHFGARYVDAKTDYTGQGVDQLARIVHTLRTNPYDRRLVLSAWNPADMPRMVLPPCHMFAQFYVSFPAASRTAPNPTPETETNPESPPPHHQHQQQQQEQQQQPQVGHLHCQLYQRSCDMGLGVPFNIASYALLTHMLAHVCGLVPGSLTHVMGDAHVYLNHVEALRTQLLREPRDFPELEIARPPVAAGEEDAMIDGWRAEDFVIKGYNPHKGIVMEMSV
ncbi:thymidylate synthase [Parathielavia hyrcaniae]|uniref:thymidylate synthase n=1 Tax=Parathielavia hyrcaniae TaxID=113614 RepID=A0AAN6T121_9PEZI|nr:thymidylate synthase [Parathielavia hyrcaniae]